MIAADLDIFNQNVQNSLKKPNKKMKSYNISHSDEETDESGANLTMIL